MSHAETAPPAAQPFAIVLDVPMHRSLSARLGPVTMAIRALAAAPVGASVFLPNDGTMTANHISSRTHQTGGRGWASARKCDGGFRVWKVAEPKAR